MNAVAMKSFGFEDQLVRVVDRNGGAWFVANDVCEVLEIGNSRDAVSRLEEDERDCVGIADAMGRDRETTIISESGMYFLVMTSRKAAAKRFRKWVTAEVLPTIRRTGRYEIVANDDAPSISLETPDELEILTKKLAIVREVRIAFGLRRARQAWHDLRLLPSLTDHFEEPQPFGPVGVIADLNRSVASWLDARTESAPGHREWSGVLYDDYLTWAKAEAIDRNEVVTLTQFGRALSHCGIRSGRSSRVYRVGLKLVG